jgi:hypothetical protein
MSVHSFDGCLPAWLSVWLSNARNFHRPGKTRTGRGSGGTSAAFVENLLCLLTPLTHSALNILPPVHFDGVPRDLEVTEVTHFSVQFF